MIRATLEFELPENLEEYTHSIRGQDYYNALQEFVNILRNHIKYNDGEDEDIHSVLQAFEKMYERIFWVCKEHGFSPWEER